MASVALALTFSQTGAAQIKGTAHDFSGASWNSTGDACIACHPGENTDSNPDGEFAVGGPSPGYVMYSSSQLDANVGPPEGASKMCLSCHDGSVAGSIFQADSGTNGMSITASIGADLSNDHPISFTYDSALASKDGSLRDPSIAKSGLGDTISSDLLSDGKMQCTSCHDPHSNRYGKFLVMNNEGDVLCITCHAK